jgi:lysozyme
MAKVNPKAGIAAALATATALVGAWEGMRTDPYADIVGRMTVCFGETNVPMRHYSSGECKQMLSGSLEKYAAGVLKRNPELADRPNQLAAATSLSYNIGPSAYARSTVARRFDVGDWQGGCNAFLAWNRAGGRVVKGLTRRREAEREICLRGLS